MQAYSSNQQEKTTAVQYSMCIHLDMIPQRDGRIIPIPRDKSCVNKQAAATPEYWRKKLSGTNWLFIQYVFIAKSVSVLAAGC